MTKEEHQSIHKELHKSFDQLLGDFLMHHPYKRLNEILLMELLEWSYRQTIEPDDLESSGD